MGRERGHPNRVCGVSWTGPRWCRPSRFSDSGGSRVPRPKVQNRDLTKCHVRPESHWTGTRVTKDRGLPFTPTPGVPFVRNLRSPLLLHRVRGPEGSCWLRTLKSTPGSDLDTSFPTDFRTGRLPLSSSSVQPVSSGREEGGPPVWERDIGLGVDSCLVGSPLRDFGSGLVFRSYRVVSERHQ